MRVLVACEESQAVCKAFRALGHEAYSCDIQPCSGGHPEWHIQEDVIPLLSPLDSDRCAFHTQEGKVHVCPVRWDMIIAFPPCTDLASSGARHFEKKRADGRQQASIDFFMEFANADCPKIAIENPVGIMSTAYRKPDCIIQPYYFGDPVQKTTCLWLKGLPQLKPETTEKPELKYHEWTTKYGERKRQTEWFYNTRRAGVNRGKIASKTFPGIARAMAEQWGGSTEPYQICFEDLEETEFEKVF